jgi:transposase
MAYSMDFIKTAVAYKQNGHTFKELRETFGIPSQTYYQWEKNLANGYYEVKKEKQERKRKIDKEQLRQAVANKPDAYLYELAELFGCTPQAIFYMLEKMNITLKKRPLPIMKSQKQNAPGLLKG